MRTELSELEKRTLRALHAGYTLKSHRHLNGANAFQLHPLEGPPQTVQRTTVDRLRRYRLIESNKKFPAATFLLTEKGKLVAASL